VKGRWPNDGKLTTFFPRLLGKRTPDGPASLSIAGHEPGSVSMRNHASCAQVLSMAADLSGKNS